MAEYTFYARFEEYIPLRYGIKDVWIGKGISSDNDEAGALYAEYVDGKIQNVGFVSDYNQAVASGYTGSYEQWVTLLKNTANNAIKAEQQAQEAEAWATGGSEGTPSITNNSRYFASSSRAWATGLDLSGDVVPSREYDNSKYYSEQSASSATSASTSASNASTYETQANKAKTAAQTAQAAAETAQSAAETAQSLAETAQSEAETAQSLAESAQSAAEAAQSLAETAQSASEAAQDAAEEAQAKAEDAITKKPYISQTDWNWYIWDIQRQEWVDTGIDARGIQGPQGLPGRDAEQIDVGANSYAFEIDSNGCLILIYTTAEPPAFRIDEHGYLLYDL